MGQCTLLAWLTFFEGGIFCQIAGANRSEQGVSKNTPEASKNTSKGSQERGVDNQKRLKDEQDDHRTEVETARGGNNMELYSEDESNGETGE